jgi:hypothetical protein
VVVVRSDHTPSVWTAAGLQPNEAPQYHEDPVETISNCHGELFSINSALDLFFAFGAPFQVESISQGIKNTRIENTAQSSFFNFELPRPLPIHA